MTFLVRCLDTADDCYLAKYPAPRPNMYEARLTQDAHRVAAGHEARIEEVARE